VSDLPRELRELIASGPMAHLSTINASSRRRRVLAMSCATPSSASAALAPGRRPRT